MTKRAIQLRIAYDGTNFGGWQRQKNARSVQGEIEAALATMHGHHVSLTGAGRTDAGVHARGQVACFLTDIASIPAQKFMPALNKLLPQDVRILSAASAPATFHARFDASMRRYRYYIACGTAVDPFVMRRAHVLRQWPRLDLLNHAAAVIVGDHDFTAFSSARDISPTKRRFVQESIFFFEEGLLVYQIAANAFLMRMVRSLVGTILHIEATLEASCDAPDLAAERMRRIMESRDRKAAGPTAPPAGLFLWNIEYGQRIHGTLAPPEAIDPEDAALPVRRLVPGIGWIDG